MKKFLEERDKRYDERFKAQEAAILKAEAATERRFQSVNEFRQTLSDQATGFFMRNEALMKFDSFDEKIDGLKKDIQSLRESRSESAGGISTTGKLISIVIAGAAVVQVIFHFFKL